MIRNDRVIQSLVYGDMVENVAKMHNTGISEARTTIAHMSFSEYMRLEEASADIVPPSGQTIGANKVVPQSQPAATGPITAQGPGAQTAPQSGAQPQQNQAMQQGQVNDPRGIQVKNPVTGKMEWMMPAVTDQSGQPQQQVAQQVQQAQQQMAEDKDLARLRQLAGIKEDASCGATGAGSIAVAPAAMGTTKRRQETNEAPPKEYTRTAPPKTIVGDTKPNQASGELSANLAARGKRTASRTNNGLRR